MPQWFINGQRVAVRRRDGSIARGTIVVARGDYSDVEWDHRPDVLVTVYNDNLTKIPSTTTHTGESTP